MQIKRFEAKNMTTALRMIKGELGPEAVILSARSLRQGKGFFGSMKYAGVEVTAAIDTREAPIKTGNSASTKTAYTKLSGSPSYPAGQAGQKENGLSEGYASYGRAGKKERLPKSKVDSSNHRTFSLLYQQMLTQGVDRYIATGLIDEIKRIPAARDLVTTGDLKGQLISLLDEMGVRADINAFGKGQPNMAALIGSTLN